MKKRITSAVLFGALFAAVSGMSFAAKDAGDADIAKVRAEVSKVIPQVESAEVSATDASGVYQINIGGSFFYAYVSGDMVLVGDLYNSTNKKNLGEAAQAEFINTFSEQMIVYGPKDAKRFVTVFTDIDCGYCRKLHNEVPALNEAGVQVRYLAFPRAGIGSESYNKYVSVWCNDDPQQALTDAKAGKSVESATCTNPIADTWKLGRSFGVTGTPTIIIDDGTRAPGYMPADSLLQRMGLGAE